MEFATEAGVDAALALNGSTVRGKEMMVLRSQPPRAAPGAASATAFVKGLGAGGTEAELRGLFADAPGGVKDVRLPKGEDGKPKVGGM